MRRIDPGRRAARKAPVDVECRPAVRACGARLVEVRRVPLQQRQRSRVQPRERLDRLSPCACCGGLKCAAHRRLRQRRAQDQRLVLSEDSLGDGLGGGVA